MKRFLIIFTAVLVCLPLLWYGALTSERLREVRGAAQFVHLPDNFFAASAPLALRKENGRRQTVDFAFTPKYSGRYQILVAPVKKQYGAVIHADSVLTCEAQAHKFQVSSDGGRVEFDTALNLGFAGRLLTFDTAQHALIGVSYQCKLSIEPGQELFLEHAYVRKLTDV